MFNIRRKNKKKGFSLIELVVVIAIMAVLAAVFVPSLIHYMEDSRVQRDDSAMNELVSLTKSILDSDPDAYDELYVLGQYVDVNDPSIYVLFQEDIEGQGLTPHVAGQDLEEIAPTYYAKLKQAMSEPYIIESATYANQYYIIDIQRDADYELRWVTGYWSETPKVNNTKDTFNPVTPDIPNIPDPPDFPEDIPDVEPGKDVEDNPNPTVPEVDPDDTRTVATGTDPVGLTIEWTGEAQSLITPGWSDQGTYYYSITGRNHNLWQNGSPRETAVGKYRIAYYIKGDENHLDSPVKYIDAEIIAKNLEITAPTGREVIYSGNFESLIGTLGTVSPSSEAYFVYSVSAVGNVSDVWDKNPPLRKEIGVYTIKWKIEATANVKIPDDKKSGEFTSEIKRWEGTYGLPEAKNLTYNGDSQELVSAALVPSGCSVFYYLQQGNESFEWGSAIPTAVNAGTYNVWYKIYGGGVYQDVGETLVEVTINKKTPDISFSPASLELSEQLNSFLVTLVTRSVGYPTVTSPDPSIVTVSKQENSYQFTVTGATKVGSVDLDVYLPEKENFTALSVKYPVTVKAGEITASTTNGKATYNGNPIPETVHKAHVFVTNPTTGYTVYYKLQGTEQWSDKMPAVTNAGTYTVDYKVEADRYNTKTGTFTITIDKATVVLNKTPELYPTLTGYEWKLEPTGLSPTITQPVTNNNSPHWEFVGAAIADSTYGGYKVGGTIITLPIINSVGELHLTDVKLTDATGNYNDIVISTGFSLMSKITGQTTVSNVLSLICKPAAVMAIVYENPNDPGKGVLSFCDYAPTVPHEIVCDDVENIPIGSGQDNDVQAPWSKYAEYINKVVFETTVQPKTCAAWFRGFAVTQASDFENMERLDLSKTRDTRFMFAECKNLKTLDVSMLDTSKVPNMSYMFASNKSLDTITDISDLKTDSAVYLDGIFFQCALSGQVLELNWNTANCETMANMFSECRCAALDLTKFDTTNVRSMANMFMSCYSLGKLKLGFETPNLTTIQKMFAGCTNLDTISLSSFDMTNVTDMSQAFAYATKLLGVTWPKYCNTENVETISGMYTDCENLRSVSFDSWTTTKKITDMSFVFQGCRHLETIDISKWDTSSVTTMESIFGGCAYVRSLNLDNFITTSLLNTQSMFAGCERLEMLSMANFNTKTVTNMGGMFSICNILKTVTIGRNFRWKSVEDGDSSYLPAIQKNYVPAADGKWYDVETAIGYTPAELSRFVNTTDTSIESVWNVKTFSSVPYYMLDVVNAWDNYNESETIEDYGTVDVYIDDKLVESGVTEYKKPFIYGTKYKFTNVQSLPSVTYRGSIDLADANVNAGISTTASSDEIEDIEGTLTAPVKLWMKFVIDEAHYKALPDAIDTEKLQEYTAPVSGYYYINAIGATGGNSIHNGVEQETGANPGASAGYIWLEKGQTIYIACGETGATPVQGADTAGGWNGGGNGTHDHSPNEVTQKTAETAGGGGGATSIYTKPIDNGELANYDKDRDAVILVAGGGAGGVGLKGEVYNGVGGGLEGGIGTTPRKTIINPATQTSGYKFGKGESPKYPFSEKNNEIVDGLAGAGGGWYGGLVSTPQKTAGDDENNYYKNIAGGGSSYIGGVLLGQTWSGVDNNKDINGSATIQFVGKQLPISREQETYEYTGYVQAYVAPHDGYYYLEVAGAQGGQSFVDNTARDMGAKGGYSAGYVYLTEGQIIYVSVGSQGRYVGDNGTYSNNVPKAKYDTIGGWNGGGNGTHDHNPTEGNGPEVSGAGGGATSIQLTLVGDGQLMNYGNSQEDVVIVAGGGGGGSGVYVSSGVGGGTTGGVASNNTIAPATQTWGYQFGKGQDAVWPSDWVANDNTRGLAGGGGGWYGGFISIVKGGNGNESGGGSGYIGGVIRGTMDSGKNQGNGKAVITYCGTEMPYSHASEMFQGTNAIQTYIAPESGYYLLIAYGAQGGDALCDTKQYSTGACGGYAEGYMWLEKGQAIYIAAGTQGAKPVVGKVTAGGWNGGGDGIDDHNPNESNGQEVAGGGGGATAFYTDVVGDGQLYNYKDHTGLVILVAGGGAGGYANNKDIAGVGGGLYGGNANNNNLPQATQTSGFAFGQGESGVWPEGWAANASTGGVPGAGGGWYGGQIYYETGNMAAGGGSSYISPNHIQNGTTTSGVNSNNGLATVQYIGEELPKYSDTDTYSYTGDIQLYVAPKDGYYYIEALGASGGNAHCNGVIYKSGAAGGQVSATVYLSEGEKLYIAVGGQGILNGTKKDSIGGWNGGGNGTHDHNPTEDNSPEVAGAGGGAGSEADGRSKGGIGGGIQGGIGTKGEANGVQPATQTSGYAFGKGESPIWPSGWKLNAATGGLPGAGGGWYGGFATYKTGDYVNSAGGGSGYYNSERVYSGGFDESKTNANASGKVTISYLGQSPIPS